VSLDELIMGRNCLQELLTHAPARLREVFFAETREDSQSTRKLDLRDAVEQAGIPIRECRRDELDALVQSDSHQGVVARVTPRTLVSLEELVECRTDAALGVGRRARSAQSRSGAPRGRVFRC
jgi:tRNA G18 (ribose-2'-O)-methylase SpoU